MLKNEKKSKKEKKQRLHKRLLTGKQGYVNSQREGVVSITVEKCLKLR